MRPRIRRATSADASALAAVQLASWRRAYRGLLDAAYLGRLAATRLEAAWRETLARASTAPECEAVLVAEAGCVSGYCHLGAAPADLTRLPGRDSGEVFSLYVHPASWRRGHGQALLARAEASLAAAGFTWGTLWVLEGNARACAFYEASGWRRDGARQFDYLGGRSYPLVRFARALLAPTPPASEQPPCARTRSPSEVATGGQPLA